MFLALSMQAACMVLGFSGLQWTHLREDAAVCEPKYTLGGVLGKLLMNPESRDAERHSSAGT